MIPKVIHYCWFGGKPLSPEAVRCIESWKRYCPNYEIKRWDESNFDVWESPYSAEAYKNKKYAFVSDYARLRIIEQEGGIYFDVDVELRKPLDTILTQGAFMGCEEDGRDGIRVNPGLGIAAPPHLSVLADLVRLYQDLKYEIPKENGSVKTIVDYTTEVLRQYGLQDIAGIQKIAGLSVYPREYFSPQHYKTGKIKITENSVSIHHYAASWFTPYQKFVYKLSHILGEDQMRVLVKCKKTVKALLRR